MSEASPGNWRQRLSRQLLDQLRQGTSPEALATAVAAGITLGIFPILGSTTLLCALAGIAFRLNQPAIQAVNYVVYPLQLILLIPFYRLGEKLFGAEPVPILSIEALTARFEAGPGQFLIDYGLVGLYGIAVWALLALPVFWIVRALAMSPIRRMLRRQHSHRAE